MQDHGDRELRQLQHCVLSGLPSTLLLLDHNLDVVFCNHDGVALGGEPCQNPVGRNLADVVPDVALVASSLPDLAQCVLKTGEKQHARRVKVEAESGDDVRYLDFALVAVPDAGDGEAGVLVRIEDVTEQCMADSQQYQALKMTSVARLAGGVAHDFNNLLMVVMTSAEFAKEELAPESTALEDIDDILAAAERASKLTRQLLALSRRQPLTTFLLSLNTLIEDATEELGERLGDEVNLVLDLGADLPLVKADATQLEEVLLTLAVNAREAMRDGGVFTLSTAPVELTARDAHRFIEGSGLVPGTFVQLLVSDTGRGMDETVKVQIFEPFFTTKEKGKGPGLGLATVYGIVKQHKGYIAVTSEPEKGTTFSICLPSLAYVPES